MELSPDNLSNLSAVRGTAGEVSSRVAHRIAAEPLARGIEAMDWGRSLLAMIALASVYLAFTLSVVTLAHLGSLSWASARELIESVTVLSSLAVGGIIGYRLSDITAK